MQVAQMKLENSGAKAAQVSLHDLAQPLNVIRLASVNIRVRIVPELSEAEAEYLASKLDRIERQVDRIAAMFEETCSQSSPQFKTGN